MKENRDKLLPQRSYLEWLLIGARTAAAGYFVMGVVNAVLYAVNYGPAPITEFRWTQPIQQVFGAGIQALLIVIAAEILASLAARWD